MKKILIIILGALLAVGIGISLSAAKGSAPSPAPQAIAADSTSYLSSSLPIATLIVAAAIVGLYLFFLPTIYAYKTKHPKRDFVLLLNILIGWTFIGWIVALIFAAIRTSRTLEEELEALEKLQTDGKISYGEYTAKRARLLS